MSGSIERMASETRCLLFQKPRQLSCTIVNILIYYFLPTGFLTVPFRSVTRGELSFVALVWLSEGVVVEQGLGLVPVLFEFVGVGVDVGVGDVEQLGWGSSLV